MTQCPLAKASPGREEIWYKREGPINLVKNNNNNKNPLKLKPML